MRRTKRAIATDSSHRPRRIWQQRIKTSGHDRPLRPHVRQHCLTPRGSDPVSWREAVLGAGCPSIFFETGEDDAAGCA
ncbi:MAG TPA: hypothetical protein PLT35_07160, partial [Vicinamibacterales bacterium]|nr:hypothetical protein [Vicinamibacterales bacterium]